MVNKQLQYNISQSKSGKTMKFGQLNEHTKKNIFLQKIMQKRGGRSSSRSLFAFLKSFIWTFFSSGQKFSEQNFQKHYICDNFLKFLK